MQVVVVVAPPCSSLFGVVGWVGGRDRERLGCLDLLLGSVFEVDPEWLGAHVSLVTRRRKEGLASIMQWWWLPLELEMLMMRCGGGGGGPAADSKQIGGNRGGKRERKRSCLEGCCTVVEREEEIVTTNKVAKIKRNGRTEDNISWICVV